MGQEPLDVASLNDESLDLEFSSTTRALQHGGGAVCVARVPGKRDGHYATVDEGDGQGVRPGGSNQ